MITTNKKKLKGVYETLNPILMVSRFAGVCCIIRRAKHNIGISKIMILVQTVILTVSILHLMFIPYAVIFIELMPEANEGTSEKNGGLSSQKFITKMANLILISMTSILVRISNLLKMYKILPSLLNDLESFDRQNHIVNRDSAWILAVSGEITWDLYFYMYLFTVIIVLVSWPYQMYSIMIVTTDNWMAFLMFYLNLYNNFTIISCEFQFVSLCWIIKSRYIRIIEELEAMYCKNVFETDERAIIKMISRLRDRTKILMECCSKLNNLYNFQLLVILNSLTLNSLFGLYFAIFGGFTKNSNRTSLNFQRISNITNEIILCFYYIIRFSFVCIVAGQLTDLINSSKKIICNVIIKPFSRNIKENLWEYLAYTSIYEVHFSACGFFKINIALISSAVSLGTTYLVILAQFQKK